MPVFNLNIPATGFLVPDVRVANQSFGQDIAINNHGNVIFVGANDSLQVGGIYVFTGRATGLRQYQRLAGVGYTGGFLGNYGGVGYNLTLSPKNNVLLAGALDGPSVEGALHIYTGNGYKFSGAAKIKANDPGIFDWFGKSSAINYEENTIVVGAHDFGLNATGAAYVFTGSGANWHQAAKIIANDFANYRYFGNSVVINENGNFIAIGSPAAERSFGIPPDNGGQVYIFTGSGTNWLQVAKISGNDTKIGDRFGMSVAINSAGNMLAIGAPDHIVSFRNTGAIYIFTGSGANWHQTAKVYGTGYFSDWNYETNLGKKVQLNSKGNILAGYGGFKNNVQEYGFVNIFSISTTGWTQYAEITQRSAAGTLLTIPNGPGSFGMNRSGNILALSRYYEPIWIAPNVASLTNVGDAYVYEFNVPITKEPQTITFPTIPTQNCGNIFNPGATASSSLPVTYEISNSAIAIKTIFSGLEYLSIINTGTITVTGFQTGDLFYNPATPISQTFNVVKGNQTINFPNISGKYGSPVITLTGLASSFIPLTYYLSGTPRIANIINQNQVNVTGTGQNFIVAVQSGNSCFNSATGISILNISKGDQTIFFTPIPIKTTISPPFLLNVFSNVGLPIQISGDYIPIADINNFTVTLSGLVGQRTITALQTGNNFYNAAQPVSRSLVVNSILQPPTVTSCLCDIIDISAGGYHNTVLINNYKVTGFGNNNFLQRDFPNQIRYAYNITAGTNYSQAIMKTGINTGVINEYLHFPDGYGLFESENGLGKNNILGGTFNFPWISTGAYNEILGTKDPLSGICLHPLKSYGELNYVHKDGNSLPSNTLVQELTPEAPLTKPAINIIKVNNLPPGLSISGNLGPINSDFIILGPKPFKVEVPLFILTGAIGPLYREYQKIKLLELVVNSSGFFATGKNDYNQSETFNITGIKSAIAGKDCSFVIYNNGKITGWGESLFGENLSNISSNFSNVKDISNKGNHTLVLFENNKISGYGSDIYGESTLGQNILNVTGISAGFTHSLALLNNGKITGWGSNSLNQVSGTSIFYSNWEDTPAGKITGAVKISAGIYHNLICLANKTITGYGDNTFEKISRGLFLTGVLDVAAGENHSIALLENGRVTGWGNNQFNQVSGSSDVFLNWESTPVGILSGVQAISTAFNHNLALLNNGKVTGWGLNAFKQHFLINVNPYLSGVTKISAGKNHSLFCISDAIAETIQNTNIPIDITGNLTGFGVTGSELVITGFGEPNIIFINKPIGLKNGYIPQTNLITGIVNTPGNYNTYFLIDEVGADERQYSERYMTFTVLETGRFPTIFKVCGGTIGLIDQILN